MPFLHSRTFASLLLGLALATGAVFASEDSCLTGKPGVYPPYTRPEDKERIDMFRGMYQLYASAKDDNNKAHFMEVLAHATMPQFNVSYCTLEILKLIEGHLNLASPDPVAMSNELTSYVRALGTIQAFRTDATLRSDMLMDLFLRKNYTMAQPKTGPKVAFSPELIEQETVRFKEYIARALEIGSSGLVLNSKKYQNFLRNVIGNYTEYRVRWAFTKQLDYLLDVKFGSLVENRALLSKWIRDLEGFINTNLELKDSQQNWALMCAADMIVLIGKYARLYGLEKEAKPVLEAIGKIGFTPKQRMYVPVERIQLEVKVAIARVDHIK